MATDHEWKEVRNRDGVKIFNRSVNGSKIKEYKAEMELDGMYFDKLCAILYDVENYNKWLDKCADSELIKKENELSFVVYNRHDTPWPSNDRDNFTRMKFQKSEEVFTVQIENLPDYAPTKKKVVRIRDLRANWKVEKLNSGKIRVTEVVWFDPLKLPAFIINMVTTDSPFQSFLNLKELLGADKSQ